MITELTIKAYWDSEALVWVAASGDVPGLIADAYTLEKLFTKLAILAPELLELNGVQEPHLKRMNEPENDPQRHKS